MLENPKTVLLISLFLTSMMWFSTPATAGTTDDTIDVSNWDIEVLERPYSYRNVSAGTSSYQLANLTTDSGEPINDTLLEGSFEMEYNWKNGELRKDMTHYKDGLWYAGINVTDSISGELLFEARGETTDPEMPDSSDVTANATRMLNYTYYVTDLDTELNDMYNAGQDIDLAANLSEYSSGANEDQANVNVYFTNVSHTSGMYSLGYNPDNELYTNTVSVPNQPNSTYFMHVNASTLGGEGVSSYRISTYPSIEGKVEYVNGSSSMCDQEISPGSCEPDAEIDTGFNITSSDAQDVNITQMVRNESGLFVLNQTAVSGGSGFYEASFTYPEFDVSDVDNELIIRYRAVNGERETTRYYNISKAGFYLDDNSALNAYQGSDFEVKTFIGRPHSLRVYPEDQLKNGSFEVMTSEDTQLTNFSLSNMTFDSANEIFKKTISIPADAPTGSYTIHADVFNTFNRMESLEPAAGFRVKDISQTFSAPEEVSFNINNTGILRRNITLNNSISTEVEVNSTLKGDLTNYTKVVDGDNITIPGDGNATATLEFNVTEFNDHEGNITFYDENSPYNTTTNISLNTIDCDTISGDLCLDHNADEWFNVTTDERGTTESSIEMYNVGPQDELTNVSVNVTGEIVEYMSLESNNYSFQDMETLDFNLSSSEPTDVTGRMELTEDETSILIDMGYVVDVQVLESSMDLKTTEIEFGALPEGESITKTIDAQNTGSVNIVRWFADSDTFNVTLSNRNEVEPGENITMDLTFDQITSESGEVEIEGQTGDANMTDTISVSATLLPTYEEMESQIEDRRTELEADASGEALTMLSDITVQLSSLETEMQNEQYSDAQTTYQNIQSTLDEAETMIEEQQNDQNDTGTEPEPDPEPEPEPEPEPPNQPTDSGGPPILPIAIALFLILVIGFVFYTSYIPEPGDPLYDLLGEE